MSASLIILAAGIGSRFGKGIKQLTPVDKNGSVLMDYSVYDAVKGGFDKVIFIIRRDMENYFRENIINKLSPFVKTEYCFQEMTALPAGFSCPENRAKPWGTVHALLAAKELINEPFLIVNADDWYGKSVYKDIYNFLTSAGGQCMGGFILKNTLSDMGTVTRGVCSADENNCLASVTETYKIRREEDGVIRGDQNGEHVSLDENSIVSMNLWGCTPEIIPGLEKRFAEFLGEAYEKGTAETAEYVLPTAFDSMIKSGEISVKVLPTHDKWYGMTYAEDKELVVEAMAEMVKKGDYPEELFKI